MNWGVLALGALFFVARNLAHKGALAKKLVYEPKGFRVKEWKIGYALAQIDYRITNPSQGSATLTDFYATFSYAGSKLGEAAIKEPVTIPAAGGVDLTADVRIEYLSAAAGVVAVVLELLKGDRDKVDVDIIGTMRVAGLAIPIAMKYPLSNPLSRKQ